MLCARRLRGLMIPVKSPVDDCQTLGWPIYQPERITHFKFQTNVCLNFVSSFGIVTRSGKIVCSETNFSIVLRQNGLTPRPFALLTLLVRRTGLLTRLAFACSIGPPRQQAPCVKA